MSLRFHAFAGNPIRSRTPRPSEPVSPQSALQTLRTLLLSKPHEPSSPNFKVLLFRKGRPLAGSETDGHRWHLGWLSIGECRTFLENSEVGLSEDSLAYLGCKYEDDAVYWAMDVSEASMLVNQLGARHFCFVELRTLMVATDWADSKAMGELAIAGHVSFCLRYAVLLEVLLIIFKVAVCRPDVFIIKLSNFTIDQARALLEWHNTARYCGYCGGQTVPMEAGRRKQCSNELCKKRIYPRVDPVVIMLVIDKENDRALLSRQSRFVPRMWSCLAGFIEVCLVYFHLRFSGYIIIPVSPHVFSAPPPLVYAHLSSLYGLSN
ncbi:UNVERIFIED_CONTAM: Nudix hydrolase 19, chloroplastic [Sesamum calycinum]|uniref:Nudix hydrolase 19, chloroplastic n=1 Tax=Sesamum calycinum TaxID=2727403 RepID=A0AAW2RRW1_9LAMI